MTDLIAFRRDLHRHPEIGFELERTPRMIGEQLSAAGLEVTYGVGRTGLVATLRRGPDETAIGLRADMDALPITEMTNLPYQSGTPDQFHGCGHDGHSTMLMGAALELARDPSLTRTVHFIFQPDEENGNGAKAMIADGLFDRFAMAEIYGMHNMPGMALGQFATQPGPFCAFEDNFEIKVQGRGGHASMPDRSVDALMIGASIVTQLQTIVARSLPGQDHAVVSVTEFHTDGARNIIAGNAEISGDCRGFDASVSRTIETRMRDIVQGLCAAHDASGQVAYSTSFQPLVNDPKATQSVAKAAAGQIDTAYGRVGFSEDFAAFLDHRPGAFVLMGNGEDGANALPLHNPGYDFNDAAIPHGVAFWKRLALQ